MLLIHPESAFIIQIRPVKSSQGRFTHEQAPLVSVVQMSTGARVRHSMKALLAFLQCRPRTLLVG